MKPETRIPARETVYAGHLFRSSLEATWAAFFDRLEWPWVYEPYEFAGYIPDFAIQWETPLLIEVKPALTLSAMDEYKPKVHRALSPWFDQRREVVIVGANWTVPGESCLWAGPIMGVIGRGDDDGWGAGHWTVASWTTVGDHVGFQSDAGSWTCRKCGGHPKESGCVGSPAWKYWADAAAAREAAITRLWGDAKRATRWVPGQPKPKRDGPPPFREEPAPTITPEEKARSLTFFGDLLAQLKAKPTP